MTQLPSLDSGKRAEILVVCYGNICRSPTAEVLLKHELQKLGLTSRVRVHSAGVRALVDHPAPAEVQNVAAAHGIDLSSHRGRKLTSEMARRADVVIAMDEIVEEEIWIRCGNEIDVTLWPVDDPFGGPPEAFVRAFREIQQHVVEYVQRLHANNSTRS